MCDWNKNVSVLFCKNLKSSFSKWHPHLSLRFLFILGWPGLQCTVAIKKFCFQKEFKPTAPFILNSTRSWSLIYKHFTKRNTYSKVFHKSLVCWCTLHWQIFDNKSCFDVRKYYCQETVVLRDPWSMLHMCAAPILLSHSWQM